MHDPNVSQGYVIWSLPFPVYKPVAFFPCITLSRSEQLRVATGTENVHNYSLYVTSSTLQMLHKYVHDFIDAILFKTELWTKLITKKLGVPPADPPFLLLKSTDVEDLSSYSKHRPWSLVFGSRFKHWPSVFRPKYEAIVTISTE
jgi:hypothetical protein